ncbi:MAG: arginine--tRNA ligase, partial [Clostridiales bacterium]|nr:arginine--tRNA ligase [Clostridiales bacterium]
MDYKELIAGNISEVTGLEKDKVFELIEIPPRLDMGDFAFPCFTLAKTLRKAPPLIATELAANEAITKGASE